MQENYRLARLHHRPALEAYSALQTPLLVGCGLAAASPRTSPLWASDGKTLLTPSLFLGNSHTELDFAYLIAT